MSITLIILLTVIFLGFLFLAARMVVGLIRGAQSVGFLISSIIVLIGMYDWRLGIVLIVGLLVALKLLELMAEVVARVVIRYAEKHAEQK